MQRLVQAGGLRWTHPRLVLLLALLALVAGGAATGWLLLAVGLWAASALVIGRGLPHVRLRLRLERSRLFAGERVRLEAALANPTWWPIPWIEVESRQPEDLVGGLRRVEWLPGGAVRTRMIEWYARERGVYRVGGFRLRAGDWFGLSRAEREVAPALDLVVYPRLHPLSEVPQARRLPEGPRLDRSSPFPDELPSGLRPYRPGDPRRRIAWKASARQGALQVAELPPVRELATCVFLDLQPGSWTDRAAGPERAISLAASLACDLRLGTRPFGLGTWAATRVKGAPLRTLDGPGRLLWLPPRAGRGDRQRLLELLAGVEPDPGAAPLPALLRLFARRLPWGAQCVWIVAEDSPELCQLAAAWHGRGHPVTLLCLERRTGAAARRVGGATLRVWEVVEHGGFEIR